MPAFVLTLLLAPSVAVAVPPEVRPSPSAVDGGRCIDRGVRYVSGPTGEASPHRLGDLPPANQYLAVDRSVGGCRTPIVVSTGIGTR